MFLPIESIKPRNFLSFGPESEPLKLRALNVVIGTNASGKSNLLEAIGLMATAPDDLAEFFRAGGGSAQFIWKGGGENRPASIDIFGQSSETTPFRHFLSFAIAGQTYEVVDESITFATPAGRLSSSPTFSYVNGSPTFRTGRKRDPLSRGDIDITQSIVSDRQEIDTDRRFRNLQRLYRSFRFYRARHFNQLDMVRSAQTTDLPNRSLLPNGSNLAAVINRLLNVKDARKSIDRFMSALYEGYEDLSTQVQGGTILLYLSEAGLRSPVPATRLSDGTIRWLTLLAILVDPDPPPLLCIEEPETGLHPDIVVDLAQLLREAAKRSQLIVTTHSDTLVDALTKDPESVIVCEKTDGKSTLKRLDREQLKAWLEVYTLGALWRRNMIGGVR
jgi:predicted ATPase